MKKLICLIILVFCGALLFKCKNSNSIEGTFVNIDDPKDEILFTGDHCQMQGFIVPWNGKYTIDKDFIYVNTNTEFGTVALKIISNDTLKIRNLSRGIYVRQKEK